MSPSSILLATVLLSTLACAGPRPEPVPLDRAHDSLDALAAVLVENASHRTDIHGIRACLHEFRQEAASSSIRPASAIGIDLVGAELEREFLLALAGRIHVVDSEFASPAAPALREAGIDAVGRAAHVSHLVVGDWFVRGSNLVLAVRLIEVDTHVIQAAARGVLPLSIFSDAARNELRGLRTGWATRPGAERPSEEPPVVVVESPSRFWRAVGVRTSGQAP